MTTVLLIGDYANEPNVLFQSRHWRKTTDNAAPIYRSQHVETETKKRKGDLLATHAAAMESNVFMLQSGVKPKKIPMAEPSAIECGVSAIAISVM